jgi:hypothetical protein
MADITLFQPFNMATAQTYYGNVTGATATQITIVDGGLATIYIGSFTYSGTTVFGTLETITQFNGTAETDLVTAINVNADTAETYIQNNQLQNLFQLIASGSTANTFHANTGSDVLFGYSGNDTFYLTSGGDTIDGGSGHSIVVYPGSQTQYVLTANGSGSFTVADTVSNRNGTGTFTNINYVEFSASTVVVAPQNLANVALLYEAALGRQPDILGLDGWENIFKALPASVQTMGPYGLSDVSGNYNGSLSIAAGFTSSAEFLAKYGSLTNQQFVTELYANVLDRAPDAAGLNGWLTQLSAGTTREHVLVGFADSVEAATHATLGFTGQSGYHAPWLFIV